MLKQSEQYRQFYNDDRPQIDNARKEAEALFWPKPEFVEPSPPSVPPLAEAPARKPRILSVSPPLAAPMAAETAIGRQPQSNPVVSVSQLTHIHRKRLKEARAAIFKQWDELQAKLTALDYELSAIDAYVAARQR